MRTKLRIALIKGDGIGVDVTEATIAVVDAALKRAGAVPLVYERIEAGAGYFSATGHDIESGGEGLRVVLDLGDQGALGVDG